MSWKNRISSQIKFPQDFFTTTKSKMDKVINLVLPYVGEQVFESLETDTLVQCLEVSEAWKFLATNVLLKRWKSKLYEACKTGKSTIVKLLLEHYNSEEIGMNVMIEDQVHIQKSLEEIENDAKAQLEKRKAKLQELYDEEIKYSKELASLKQVYGVEGPVILSALQEQKNMMENCVVVLSECEDKKEIM